MEFDYLSEVTKGDPDDSKKAKEFYEAHFKWALDQGMRGDTICSFGTTFGACNKSTKKGFVGLVDGRVWKRGYTKDIFNSNFKIKVEKFRVKYHTLANFWIMPRTLNKWRGSRAFGDYIDIFLNCIRNYYLDGEANKLKVINKFNDKEVKEWLDSFGEKEEGWKKFIEKNCLYAYVIKDDSLKVKDIFSKNFKKENADIIGTYHKYGKALPQNSEPKQESKDSAIYYTQNSLWALNKRTEDLKKVKI